MPILSFSVPEMLPSVAWGVLDQGEIYQPDGVDAFWDRITDQAGLTADTNTIAWMKAQGRINKTQTIRPFDFENPNPRSWHSRIKPGDYCDIWWKQRAPKLAFKLGRVKLAAVHNIRITNHPEGDLPEEIYVQVKSSRPAVPYLNYQSSDCCASLSTYGEEQLLALARADGFTSIEAFRDYFTPKPGDEFRGNLLVW